MKVGVTFWLQNCTDYRTRVLTGDYSKPSPLRDVQRYRDEKRLMALVEPLGFDSLWTIEHHFSPYGMTCDPLQILTYVAGMTDRIELGTMVIVLPWHDPVLIAEKIAVLDNLLDGRRLNIGIGRGAAAREFVPLRVSYTDSRERMMESLDVIRTALSQEFFSYDGQYFQLPRMSIRPQPASEDLTTNLLMVWASAESLDAAANSGVAPLFTNFKGWDALVADSRRFNEVHAGHGWDPVPPTVAVTIYCGEDQDEAARAGEMYWRLTSDSGVWHYDHASNDEFAPQLSAAEKEQLLTSHFESQVAAGIFGTPDFVASRLCELQQMAGVGHFVCLFSFGEMPVAESERSMRLFASEVLPSLHEIEARTAAATPFASVEKERLTTRGNREHETIDFTSP